MTGTIGFTISNPLHVAGQLVETNIVILRSQKQFNRDVNQCKGNGAFLGRTGMIASLKYLEFL